MARKKQKILGRLVKKDYDNDLEEVLLKKNFQAEVKSFLLNIMYKIDYSYTDYENAKKNVLSKQQYIENFINNIKTNCDTISFMKMDKMQRRTALVERDKKIILCYPIETKLLYCLSQINKQDDIIKSEPNVLCKSLTDLINIGNDINTTEPIRDFNGYSWDITTLNIENFYYNLIYQDLIFIVGNKKLEDWANHYNYMIDYMNLFNDYLEKTYGKKINKDISNSLKKISILLELTSNKKFKDELIKRKVEVEDKLNAMNDKISYLNNLSVQKRQIVNDIRKIELILSDKNKINEEYKRRNKELPLEKKIFSKRVLVKSLEDEQEELMINLKECNNQMNSKQFIKTQKDLKYELDYLNLVEVANFKKQMLDEIILFQKQVLKIFKLKIEKANNKKELIKILYEIRYFNLIPFDETKNISQISTLKRSLKSVEDCAIEKSYDLKLINELFKNIDLNKKIFASIFSFNIIKLEDIYFKVIKDNEFYLQFYDYDIEDKKIKIDFKFEIKDLKVKLNKKIKLFI